MSESEPIPVSGGLPGIPPIALLRAFHALVHTGGVRKAARLLNVHHSVISRHVAQLEAQLGISLGERRDGQFGVSSDGARFHKRVSAAIAEIALATSEAMGKDAARPLRIWCSPGLSIQWLAGQVSEFEQLNPQFKIALKPSETPANLHAHEADANIYFHLDGEITSRVEPGLKVHELARPCGTIAASPHLLGQLPSAKSAADLLRFPLLHGNHKDDWRLWFELNGVTVTGDLPGELCWHPNMALEAARLGRGILLANRFFFDRDFARGDLKELILPGIVQPSFGSYQFIARENAWSTPALATARKFLSERMKGLE